MQFILLASLLLIREAKGHIALWDPGMYGFNGSNNAVADYNNRAPSQPLRFDQALITTEWFAHGFQNLPPKAGDFLTLPAGGTYHGEVACIRSDTKWRDPSLTGDLPEYACKEIGSLHTILNLGEPTNEKWLGGCALAINYESDVTQVQPDDFVVFSVNHECVWKREIDFQIPQNMPACSPGGCHCTFNWIHQAGDTNAGGREEGYKLEMYNVLYRCNVTGSPTNSTPLGKPKLPVNCLNNTSQCVKGPKVPMYYAQVEGSNIFSDEPPLYNDMMGFADGAQNDIFVQPGSKTARSTVGKRRTPKHL